MIEKLSKNGGNVIEQRINFEQFCAISNEWSWRLKSNGVDRESEISSVWRILCRKASKFLRRAFVHPFNRIIGIFFFFNEEINSHSINQWTRKIYE